MSSLRYVLYQLLERLWLVNSELGENLTVELNALLRKLVDEDGILSTCLADSCVKTNNPQ